MLDTRFNAAPTVIGSLPHKDPQAACALIARYLTEIPAWPQLPKRAFEEDMTVQFTERFPGITVDADRIFIKQDLSFDTALEALYSAYIENNYSAMSVSPAYAAGLHAFLNLEQLNSLVVKGQVPGPLSFGLTLKDEENMSLLHNEVLLDAGARFLRLKAAWQENALRRLNKNTIIFIDEPVMASYGSAFFLISKDKVLELLQEVLHGISGLRGIHCCGNTDWSVLLDTDTHIISFDAYNFTGSLALYPEAVKALLLRGGAVAWGIIPNTEEALLKESISSLKDRLEEAMAPFTRHGVRFQQLIEQSLLTPSCGLAGLSEEGAETVLDRLVNLSVRMRNRTY
ncbi:MAG: methionine synthase [Dehalococcoidia bacterium]|nr:methionine synthase [Dehalococcoidia bacterium]